MADLDKELKAMANKRRLAVISYLKKHKEASVSEIAEVINLSLKATSKHLMILASRDILEKEQRSLQMFYSLSKRQSKLISSILNLL